MHWSLLCLVALAAVAHGGVIPRYEAAELRYDTKAGPYNHDQALQHKDLHHKPLNPLSYPSYPYFFPYPPAPYYFPNFPYYHMPYYNKANLEKDGKQAPLQAPGYDFKAPIYNFKAPAYDFKVPQDLKQQNFQVPQYVYPAFPLKKEPLQHQAPVPAPPPVVQEPKPELHQEYKEVEILPPEVHEVPPVEHEEQQIVHKDEPAFRSFIFIGKYSGSCKGEKDGLYYVDKKTFAYCVDQRDVFQPCPEGTENPEAEEFMNGKLQYSHHFCSVNLLAQNPEPVPTHADPHYNTYQYEEVPEEKY